MCLRVFWYLCFTAILYDTCLIMSARGSLVLYTKSVYEWGLCNLVCACALLLCDIHSTVCMCACVFGECWPGRDSFFFFVATHTQCGRSVHVGVSACFCYLM